MAQAAMLTRLRSLLYPFVQQNNLSDLVLLGPATTVGELGAAVDLLQHDGRLVDPNTVTIQSDRVTVTQVADVDRVLPDGTVVNTALVDWTTRYRIGDELIIGGSTKGNNGIRRITAVSSSQITVATPWAAAEAGLSYGKPTYALLNRCRELLLFAGGYETDTELRAFLRQWIATMQRRGSRSGIRTEMSRVTRSNATYILESVPNLSRLGAGIAYTHSTTSLVGSGWSSRVTVGDPITITQSVRDSNGRYTVYGVVGTDVLIGHRAAQSSRYADVTTANRVELQFREDRVRNQLGIRLVQTGGGSTTVALTVAVANASWGTGAVWSGTGTVSTTATTATCSLTVTGGTVTLPVVSEIVLNLSGVVATTTFTPVLTAGTPTMVRLGLLGLCPTNVNGTPALSTLWPWRWTGIVRTGLRSGVNESDLTVDERARPGWYLGIGCPESAEEDPYTIVSPDDFAVVEADHRNPDHYTERNLHTLVRNVLLPADVDGALILL